MTTPTNSPRLVEVAVVLALSGVLAAIRLPVPADAIEGLRTALETAYGPDLVVGEREGFPGWLLVTRADNRSPR